MLRKIHLISIFIIVLVEIAFLIAVITCCITQSKSILKINRWFLILNWLFFLKGILGLILAVLLILLSLIALMTLIYFLRKFLYVFHLAKNIFSHILLVEDVFKERVEPYPDDLSPYKSYEIQEIQSISRHESPIPDPADDTAIPINTPTVFPSFPRLPTPPTPTISPPLEKPVTPPIEKTMTPPPMENLFSFPQESAFIVDFDKVRRGIFSYFKSINSN
jgi:hypothetical protein